MFNLAVFVSGRGSNLESILNYFTGSNICVKAVVSNKIDCPAIELAKQNNISYHFVGASSNDQIISFSKLIEVLKKLNIDLVVLAGFLKKIPDEFVDHFKNRIINIHPALLPAFGGKGMYGSNVHKAVFDSSAQISGATVHFVDKIYDNGKIIAQKVVDISNVKEPGEIAERVLKIEHELLPAVIKKIEEKKVLIENNRVYIKI
jgi:formyltetrahydrofolate-dependent phosphoribosylglycinamide formyltransferase